MTDVKANETARLIAQFRKQNPDAQCTDWNRLIEEHPEHASAIADAALQAEIARLSSLVDGENDADRALYDATISQVLSLVHQTPSPILLEVQEKIAAVQGPRIKKIAEDIGIGPHASLLSGVLSGRTNPPHCILSALALWFDVSCVALAEAVRRNFASAEIPAFKARTRPHVGAKPISWEEAVRGLKLPARETQRLLRMATKPSP